MNTYTTYTDLDLLEFIREGNRHAFEEVYNRYHKSIYRYLISIFQVPDMAEDLTHEVFIKLWEVREKLDIKGNFKSYLFRMSHNLAVDMSKALARDRQLRDRLILHYQGFSDMELRTLEELKRFDNLVEEALQSLSPARRRVYELCKIEGKTYQEAADLLQISPNTVKEHMGQALATLRNFVKEKGHLPLIFMMLQELL